MENNTNINSFAQQMNRTIGQQANQLALLRAIQESISSTDAYVNFDYTDDNGNTIQFQVPSYDSVVRRLHAVEQSLDSLSTGKGTVSLQDGSRRTVTLSSIPHTPDRITGLADPSTFTIDSNWFFEELMFPGARVSVDLTGQIEDTADRVRVTRIILSADNNDARTLWENDLSQNNYDYVALKNVLAQNGVPYYEDEETVQMPLVSNQATGTFQVIRDPEIRQGKVWYYIDNITYSTISTDGVDQGKNNVLSVGDTVSYQDSIFEVLEIDQVEMKVRLRRTSGVQSPGMYSMLALYQDPFRSKTIQVRFGAHEYNIIYFKGVSENYNLLGNTWSTPVKFSSDDLVLEGTSGLQETPFANYYAQYIMDWGQNMIAEYRERKIPAWFGHTPNAPTLAGSDFRVVQINTQINAAIDTTDVKNTAAEIQSVKSQIASLKNTIAAQKSEAQGISEQYAYNALQQQIETNTNDLNNLQTTYSTLVSSFQSIVRENSAVTTDPKYHIRGFFDIPEFKFTDDTQSKTEEIIGFDIAYRYIKEDSTATQLNTFTYTSVDGTEHTGTFTDWIVEQGPLKTKVLDSESGQFVWRAENIADGTETNINQIDIAISKGEKVEIKVRSISEAGYPSNPLRSAWSESVIIDFPPTLATGNQIADLIEEVNSDALTLTVQQSLDSLGVGTHLDDTIANKNSVTGLYFKHLAGNIAYEQETEDSSGNVTVQSISVQKKLDDMAKILNSVSDAQTQATNVANDTSAKVAQNTTLFTEEIYDLSTSVSNVGNTISEMNAGLKSMLTVNKDASGNYHPQLKAESYSLMGTTGVSRSFVRLLDDDSSDIVMSSRPGNTTDSLSRVWVNDVVFSNVGGDTAQERLRALEVSDASLFDEVGQRAKQTDLDKTNERLDSTDTSVKDIYGIAKAANASLNEIYEPGGEYPTVKAQRFRVGSGAMQSATDSIDFVGSGGSYTTIKVQDVLIPVQTGSATTMVSMKRINTLLDDTVTEKNDLQTNFYKLKDVVDHVIASAEGEDGYNVYANNVITTNANVDGTITIQSLQVKGSEFSPVDSNGNRVPGRFTNVFIDNTDVQNSIVNLTTATQNIQESLENIGVNEKIRKESGGLTIDAYTGSFQNMSSQTYNVVDSNKIVVGYIECDTEGNFVFYKSGSQGGTNRASLFCDSINFMNGALMKGTTVNDIKYLKTENLAVDNHLSAKDASITNVEATTGSFNKLTITNGGEISGKDGYVMINNVSVRNELKTNNVTITGHLSAIDASITNVEASTGSFNKLTITNGCDISGQNSYVMINDVSVRNELKANNVAISGRMNAIDASITKVEASTGSFNKLTITNGCDISGQNGYAMINSVNVGSELRANNVAIANNLSANTAEANTGSFNELTITNGATISGNLGYTMIGNLRSNNVVTSDLTVNNNLTISGSLTIENDDIVLIRRIKTLSLWDPDEKSYRNIFDIFSRKT